MSRRPFRSDCVYVCNLRSNSAGRNSFVCATDMSVAILVAESFWNSVEKMSAVEAYWRKWKIRYALRTAEFCKLYLIEIHSCVQPTGVLTVPASASRSRRLTADIIEELTAKFESPLELFFATDAKKRWPICTHFRLEKTPNSRSEGGFVGKVSTRYRSGPWPWSGRCVDGPRYLDSLRNGPGERPTIFCMRYLQSDDLLETES